jgi:hypothetical protein
MHNYCRKRVDLLFKTKLIYINMIAIDLQLLKGTLAWLGRRLADPLPINANPSQDTPEGWSKDNFDTEIIQPEVSVALTIIHCAITGTVCWGNIHSEVALFLTHNELSDDGYGQYSSVSVNCSEFKSSDKPTMAEYEIALRHIIKYLIDEANRTLVTPLESFLAESK